MTIAPTDTRATAGPAATDAAPTQPTPEPARRIPAVDLALGLWARPRSRHEMAAQISAHVYGNMTVLAAMLALVPGSAVSSAGAWVVLAAGLSTFLAHSFSDLLGRRIGHDHRSVITAAASAARDSLPIVTAAAVPLVLLTVGAWAGWSEPLVQLAAELFICVRVGMIAAMAERIRGQVSSRRLVLVAVAIALVAASVAVAKVIIA